MKEWITMGATVIQTIAAMATVVVAKAAYKVVKQQKDLQEQQLNFALYEKRYSIYKAIMSTRKRIGSTQNPSPNIIIEMTQEIIDYEFLFDNTMRKYIDSVKDKFEEFILSDDKEKPTKELIHWMTSIAYDEITEKFLKYLDFRELK